MIGGGLRPVITCEFCSHRHRLARKITKQERIRVVCHNCESILFADVTVDAFALARMACPESPANAQPDWWRWVSAA